MKDEKEKKEKEKEKGKGKRRMFRWQHSTKKGIRNESCEVREEDES
jgi:hypothetical protein